MPMRGDEIVSILVCLSLLAGLVVGLRFNVRMLVWLCLATIVGGGILGISDTVAFGRAVSMTSVAVVALQVGYFIAQVIGAMRLADEPVAVAGEAADQEARVTRSEATRPTGA